jgi:beta-N-acetylhexosaminidase
MRAIADHYGVEAAVLRGIDAGVDQFLCCHTAELAHRAIDAVVQAVERGRISEEQLATANRRIQTFTARYAHPPVETPDLSVLRSEAHLALSERIARGPDAADPTAVMHRIASERG